MKVQLAYWGRSRLLAGSAIGAGQTLALAPNLTRDQVAFDAPLLAPQRFREAISALHDVVISDLRYQPRDKTAYEQWKKDEALRQGALRREAYKQAKEEILSRRGEPVSPELERRYRRLRRRYWTARRLYSAYLLVRDPALWRQMMPCDPVVTVADDVAFFECFSADESSYGCLTVDRDGGFGKPDCDRPGTTNVDYSWDLYHHFQSLRSYRQTRLRVDPAGFEVATQASEEYREEKIDLPDGWLRGFMQIQAAMSLPTLRVSLSTAAVYSVIAWLKRHKAKTSPRAMRFELLPGKPPSLVLEPWERRIESTGLPYDGPSTEPIRIWGTRRLLSLSRLLPLAERFDVYLLGTGLPSFWVARMGEMRLTLGLSGWTTNDWTRGSALDLLAAPAEPSLDLIGQVAHALQRQKAAGLLALQAAVGQNAATTSTALRKLAFAGQVIYDLPGQVYRWRQVMPVALGEAELGPENPELAGSKQILAERSARLESVGDVSANAKLLTGKVEGKPVELIVDADGRAKRGKCVCGYFRKFGMRNGPCRHMLAVRALWMRQESEGSASEESLLERWLRPTTN